MFNMARIITYQRWLNHYHSPLGRALINNLITRLHSHIDKTIVLEEDIMDDFTSRLMKKKIERWNLQHSKNKYLVNDTQDSAKTQSYDDSLAKLDVEEIGIMLQNCIDTSNVECVKSLIISCINSDKSPPVNQLMQTLQFLSQAGDIAGVGKIRNLCQKLHPHLLKSHSNFDHFEAEAIWIRGDVSKSLEIFERVYKENIYLRRKIRLLLKYLINDLLSNKSEAALLTIVKFSEKLLKEFGDFFPITCVWQACFLSEWFSDQCIALELLERNDGLCQSVVGRIPYVVYISLKCHRTEVVYRLLEILLKYELREQYSSVLLTLLEYQLQSGDLRSCTEIIKWAIEHNINLPQNAHIKLIHLLLNDGGSIPLSALKTKSPKHKTNYSLKF